MPGSQVPQLIAHLQPIKQSFLILLTNTNRQTVKPSKSHFKII